MNNANLEPIKVFVENRFLFDGDLVPGKTPGHLVSVRGLQNQALQFSVLLDNGALFTGLPAHAITFKVDRPIANLAQCQMWDCIGSDIEVFTLETLRYAKCEVNIEVGASKPGKYLFTVDFVSGGFSRHPTHWKQLHAVQSDDGLFLLYPQYRIKFTDKALLESEIIPPYKANTKHWIVGS
jgi:hypothetical protein